MNIEANKSLKALNTFGIDVIARQFVSVSTVDELRELIQENSSQNIFILSGGSNLLLTKDIEDLVIHINLKGISSVHETENEIHLRVMAGENWHSVVEYCLSHDYGGIENLSLIPGNTGTAPIQNIGAYGVELKDVFLECEAMHLKTQQMRIFSLAECKFGYRDSIFKTSEKGNYIICSVTLKLTKKVHNTEVSYGTITEELNNMGVTVPTIQSISQAVINIRRLKLPDPREIGNSGSFFKNPVIDKTQFDQFIARFPSAPFYMVSENEIKIPAGWLIEQAGFKGKRFGDAGVHEKQALVLVNYGNASGNDILELSKKIQAEVKGKFGITILPEVNII